MCYSYKTNYKLFSKPSSFTHHNYKCFMCPPPAARATSTRQLNSSQTRLRVSSVNRIYCSRDSVSELIQVTG